jgi:hypothetical protein
MPYKTVDEALEKNKGLAKHSAKARRGWLKSFNSCMEGGGSESKCFAVAYSVANKVDGRKASGPYRGKLAMAEERRMAVKNEVVGVAEGLARMAREMVAGERAIATNESHWSWEDDVNNRTATVYLSDDGRLRLEIVETHVKLGLGAGKKVSVLEDARIGTVDKPNLQAAIGLLKRHSHDRTRASYPFKRTWKAAYGGEAVLGDILKEYRASANPVVPLSDSEKRQEILDAVRGMSGRDLDRLLGMLGKAVPRTAGERRAFDERKLESSYQDVKSGLSGMKDVAYSLLDPRAADVAIRFVEHAEINARKAFQIIERSE